MPPRWRKDPKTVRDHQEALRSTMVTRWFRQQWEPNVLKVTAENVIAALNRAGIRPVLMGTHGLGCCGRHPAQSIGFWMWRNSGAGR